MESPVLSIISACYNEENAIPSLITALSDVMCRMVNEHLISEKSNIVLVDDGSDDDTWSKIVKAHFEISDFKVIGIRLTKNEGHQCALIAGLEYALHSSADITVTIDADLQDDTDAIVEMVKLYRQGNEIVYGVRNDRNSDTRFKRNTANLFYKLINRWESSMIKNHADFRLMNRRAVELLLEFKERNIFLRGIVPQIGLKSAFVHYSRHPRELGDTKYPLKRMINFAIEGITSFSIMPIRMIFVSGMIFLFCTLVIIIYVVTAILIGRNIPGWASIMLSVWFIGSLILIALGIIGEYVGKIYLEVKHRPRYFIESTTADINDSDNQKNE